MKRSSIKRNPSKTRDWDQRSRDRAIARAREAARNGGAPVGWKTTNPKPSRRNRVVSLRGFTQRVFCLHGRKCVVCGRRAVQAHHVVPLRTLFARSEETAVTFGGDARNGAPVCGDCHERHENASRRIRRSELPLIAREWARDHGFDWYVESDRNYPA